MEWLYGFLTTAERLQEIDWREEAEVAEELDFRCHCFDFEALLEERVEEALETMPDGNGETLVYRGWMLREEEYACLESAVAERGYQLFTPSHAHREATYLPNYYSHVADLTMSAVWTEDPDIDDAWELAQSLGKSPWIVKDHVKSHKEAWLTACYVEAGASYDAFVRVCENLLAYRGERFERGFVVRPYVPLKLIGAHSSGMPVFEEYRLIFWRGNRILTDNYSEIGDEESVDFSAYDELGQRIDSPFFAADIARTASGELILIELNDGGSVGLPPKRHPYDFYRAVATIEDHATVFEDPFA